MNRLIEIIAFTPDLERMRLFYERGVGIATTFADPHWTSFDTAGVSLALHPLEGDRTNREIELTFETRDLDADVRRLRSRGIETGPVHDEPFGRYISFRDPEGNAIGLRQSAAPVREGRGAAIGAVILNCRHLRATATFYHEALDLPVDWKNEHWVELEAGATRLALHLRPTNGDHPIHARPGVAWCFDAQDVPTWVEEMRSRGVVFESAPAEEEWGLYAEAADPDGNIVVFRTPREAETVEEQLALAFDGDAPTHAEGMRRPVRKASAGTSRLALRPAYRTKTRAGRSAKSARHRAAAAGKRGSAVSSPRGTGPAGSRQKPKVRKDTKRAKTKPATGRKKKAEETRRKRQTQAVAGASKSRRVKKASARPARPARRARVAKTGRTARGRSR